MNLELRPGIAANYKSLSQKARVMTETWAEENLYCPSCPSDALKPAPTGQRVIDFTCPDCDEHYQLKSQSHPFGFSVANSAYEPKIKAIRERRNPNYLFLHYDPLAYRVQNLFLVPKHFMTLSIVEKRKPLSANARRRGWVGSNILLGNLPADARIPIVKDGYEVPKNEVRKAWKRFLFLSEQTIYSRGWLSDVLTCVRKLDQETFNLADMYEFEDQLAKLHPRNKHIRPKIRQQLQVLRDRDIIEFLNRGNYRIIKH
jgi:type II restriction enzyme